MRLLARLIHPFRRRRTPGRHAIVPTPPARRAPVLIVTADGVTTE